MSGKRLKEIVALRNATIMPGAPNAMFARVIEDLGFETVYISGAGISNMHLGAPDIGLVTMSEIQNVVGSVSDAVSIPIVVDMDTGFGNPLNTIRTVRALERAGASGLQIEDQVFPKRCGHFSGKEVVPVDEIVQKIKAAVDTRIDPNLQIIARTTRAPYWVSTQRSSEARSSSKLVRTSSSSKRRSTKTNCGASLRKLRRRSS